MQRIKSGIFAAVGFALLTAGLMFTGSARGGATESGGLPALEKRVDALEHAVCEMQTITSKQAAQIAALRTTTRSQASQITALQTMTTSQASQITALQTMTTSQASQIAALQTTAGTQAAQITALQTADGLLQSRADALETKTQFVSVVDGEMLITGTNLHILNGLGATNGNPSDPFNDVDPTTSVNGKGNLIIGYDENDGVGFVRTGSHNLVIGNQQSYSSYGGLVAGVYNSITGPFAAVTGGIANTASGLISSVSGGEENTASGDGSSVSGGLGNIASNNYSSVSGGASNSASNIFSSVSGGTENTTSDAYGWVAGSYHSP